MATGDSGREAYTAIAWGVGLSHERSDIAGAEGFHSLEGNMCGTARRGADALPRSKATSRAKGSHRNLGDLVSGRRRRVLCVYGGPHWEGEEPKPMMHGHEKSDLVIVAMKPANKAKEAHCGVSGANAAELVERRAGAKGNTHQHNTYWTQSQARVTNALERIRPLSPSHTRGGSRMRESRTYGSVRGACDETHVPTATAARVHHAARRCGGGVAACGEGAAARADAAHRRADDLAADDADDKPASRHSCTGLQQLGWTIGRNVRIDYRWGAGNADNARKYAAELVALSPDVILANGSPSSRHCNRRPALCRSCS